MCVRHCPSFLWGVLYMCVCYIALRARVTFPLQSYWLLSLFIWPTVTSILFARGIGQNLTAILWQLAVWQYSSGCVTPGTLSEPPSTELMLPDTFHHCPCLQSDILLGCSNRASYMVDSLCHHSHRLSNGYWEEYQAVCATLDVNSAKSLRNEAQYCQSVNGALQRKGRQIKFCLFQPVTILSL